MSANRSIREVDTVLEGLKSVRGGKLLTAEDELLLRKFLQRAQNSATDALHKSIDQRRLIDEAKEISA